MSSSNTGTPMLTQHQLQNLKAGDLIRYRGDVCTVVTATAHREHAIVGQLVSVTLVSTASPAIRYGHDALSRCDRHAELIREG